MDSYSARYKFSQSFDVPARQAYEWCTDYDEDDFARMGEKGHRRIKRINDDTLILVDTQFGDGGSVTRQRLVRLNQERMAWTNTHLTGPNKHSQFWYQIVADGKGSRLEFTGLRVAYGKVPSPSAIKKMAADLTAEDAAAWRHLAAEMSKDAVSR